MPAMRITMLFVATIAAMLPGCAPAKATVGYRPGNFVDKPDAIVVRPFAATLEDAKNDSDVVPNWMLTTRAEQQSADDPRAGRAAAETIAQQVVAELKARGLPAVAWSGTPASTAKTVTIVGQFVNAGSATESLRPSVGFRTGKRLETRVQMKQGGQFIGELKAAGDGSDVNTGGASIARQIADVVVEAYRLRGWLPPTPSK